MQISEACNILLTTICRHVRTHLLKRDELEECAGLLGDAISALYEYREENKSIAPAHLDVLCLGVFNALVDSLLNLVGRTTQVLVLIIFYCFYFNLFYKCDIFILFILGCINFLSAGTSRINRNIPIKKIM